MVSHKGTKGTKAPRRSLTPQGLSGESRYDSARLACFDARLEPGGPRLRADRSLLALPPPFFGKLKRAFEELEPRSAVGHDDFDDVETKGHFRTVQHAEPGAGAFADEGFFFRSDSVGRAFPCLAGAGLDFDKREDVLIPIATDEIDFAAVPGAEIPVENFIPVPAQESRRHLFALASQTVARILGFPW